MLFLPIALVTNVFIDDETGPVVLHLVAHRACRVLKVLLAFVLLLDNTVKVEVEKLLICREKLKASTRIDQLESVELHNIVVFLRSGLHLIVLVMRGG